MLKEQKTLWGWVKVQWTKIFIHDYCVLEHCKN